MADFTAEGGEPFEVDGEDDGGLMDREAFLGDDAFFASNRMNERHMIGDRMG